MNPQLFLRHSHPKTLQGKKILVRLDLDIPKNTSTHDYERIDASLPTIQLLLSSQVSKIGLIGHWGRPYGRHMPGLSVKPLYDYIVNHVPARQRSMFVFHENLRFSTGEEENDPHFAASLSKGYDQYVFDAFAVSHRHHASVVSIPSILPTLFGLHVEQELQQLSKLFSPIKPYLAIVGGMKPETKIELIQALAKKADTVLIGGSLAKPEHLDFYKEFHNVIVAELLPHQFDISKKSIQLFKKHITRAHTIVWNGPLGKEEDEKYLYGSKTIAQSIQKSKAYSIIGGGDTISFLKKIEITANPHLYVSTGGGAMLHYISHETLPLLQSVLRS